jgi:branched-chain amino acid transport system substrate-binding protein
MGELVMQRQGGEKLAERYVPLDAKERDYADIIKDILNKRPDFIFSTVVGDSTVALYRAYAEAGFDPKTMPIASLTTSEAEISQMDDGLAIGHYTSAPYFQSIDSEANRSCLANLRRRFGDSSVPNLCWEASYFQMHIYANALRLAGDDEISVLMPYILGSEFDAPQGRIRIDPMSHHTYLFPRIGRVNSSGQFTIVRQARKSVCPDPYLVTHSIGDWAAQLDTLAY